MNKPSSWKSREDSLLFLNAYLDGELDAAAAYDVERRLAADATLKAEFDRLLELREALATHLAKERTSDSLRRRVADIPENGAPATPEVLRPRYRFDWRQMAAAVVVAACVASGTTYLSLRPSSSVASVAAILAGHQRALLATAPFDIASSDRHTVKPWFDTKLALSPQVIDLSGDGFPLAGGRIDVVGGRKVPVMVYFRRKHMISVVAVPKAGSTDNGAPPSRRTADGYTVLGWDGADFRYSAVSDLSERELETFVERWRAESRSKARSG